MCLCVHRSNGLYNQIHQSLHTPLKCFDKIRDVLNTENMSLEDWEVYVLFLNRNFILDLAPSKKITCNLKTNR